VKVYGRGGHSQQITEILWKGRSLSGKITMKVLEKGSHSQQNNSKDHH